MTYLLDTQTLIWALENNPRLSAKATKLITDGDNSLWVSIASVWEMAIKSSIKKLELTQTLEDIIKRLPEMEISLLPIQPDHILVVEKLPLLHRDPFDRIIIAQAIVEKLEIISSDEQFSLYPVIFHW